MGNEKGKNSISGILESLPGDVVLVTVDGIPLARKGTAEDSEYSEWPYISLFSGTGKACRLYWRVPGAYDPALTAGPLELLLGDLVIQGPGYWFKRLLTEPADSLDLTAVPPDVRACVPLRLGALKVGKSDVREAQEALLELLPDLKTTLVAPGLMILSLPADQEKVQEWSESILALLSEELLMDPLMIQGETVVDLGLLNPHALALEKLCDALYVRGFRGLKTLLGHLPELLAGQMIENPCVLIKDLGRLIEPVLKDPDLSLTAAVFIQTNLNIAETAQNLFLHRNTLVYRISKIEKLTGLDLKRLDQVMAFILLKAARTEAQRCDLIGG